MTSYCKIRFKFMGIDVSKEHSGSAYKTVIWREGSHWGEGRVSVWDPAERMLVRLCGRQVQGSGDNHVLVLKTIIKTFTVGIFFCLFVYFCCDGAFTEHIAFY